MDISARAISLGDRPHLQSGFLFGFLDGVQRKIRASSQPVKTLTLNAGPGNAAIVDRDNVMASGSWGRRCRAGASIQKTGGVLEEIDRKWRGGSKPKER
jgi:hypothetical protein